MVCFLLESVTPNRSHDPINKQNVFLHGQSHQSNITKSLRKMLFASKNATRMRLTSLLLIVSFVFVFCTIPISIRSLISKQLFKNRSTTQWQLTEVCFALLMYLNHTVKR